LYPEYREEEVNWWYVGGLFDAEGAVIFHVPPGSFVVKTRYEIGMKYRPVIERVAAFLGEHDIRHTVTRDEMWRLRVEEHESMLTMGAMMLPYLQVKHEQVRAAMDYLLDRITANDFYEILLKAYEEGARRVRPVLRYPLPYTQSEGRYLIAERGGLKGAIIRGFDEELKARYEELVRLTEPRTEPRKKSDLIV